MVLFVVFATALVTSVVAGGSCPEGWTFYGPQNQCLKKFDTLLTFESAQSTCQSVDADLVMVKDLAHNDFVYSLVGEGKNYWIGVSDPNKDHTFTYVDGSPLTYTYWYPGQPSNSGGNEFCTEILAYAAGGKKWNDAPCYFKSKFVCAADAKLPVHCPEGWSHYEGDDTCIKSFTSRQNYDNARKSCQSENGDLVQLQDDAHRSFVQGLTGSMSFWMGVWDDNKDKTFTYVDGSSLKSYANWNKGEPNNAGGNEQCVMVYGTGSGKGKWNDGNCRSTLGYVCSTPVIHCPDGWTFYDGDNSCIKSFASSQTYASARATCQADDGDLVQLHSDDHTAFVLALSGPPSIWIGVYDDDNKDKTFTYVDGSALGSYHPWNRGEPNNYNGREHCAMLYGTGSRKGKWNDAYCTYRMRFVCSTKGTQCPRGYSYYEGDNSCIRVFPSRQTFASARSVCQADNGDLAPIGSAADRDFILERSANMNFWFGVFDDNRDRKFTFLDGSPLTFSPWNHGEPNNSGNREYCAMSIGGGPSRGKWNDGNCQSLLAFVCSTKG